MLGIDIGADVGDMLGLSLIIALGLEVSAVEGDILG
jgi:hypothetical protein